MQKELQLSPEVRQDLKLARRAYLTQLGFIIRERQDLVRSLNDNMPNGGTHSSTSTRQAAPAAFCASNILDCQVVSESLEELPAARPLLE